MSPSIPDGCTTAPAVLPSAVTCVDHVCIPSSSSSPSLPSLRPPGRVPLSQVVTSLTHKWSVEYLHEAQAGDAEAMCLVAQMYLGEGGWGALREDQHEGKRWLLKAKAQGVGCIVNQLEDRYLPADSRIYCGDSEGGRGEGKTSRAFGRHSSQVDGGYYSGYGNSPISSPSQSLGDRGTLPAPTPSFFSTVANAITSKAASSPSPLSQPQLSVSGATSLSRSVSHDQLRIGVEEVKDSLALEELRRHGSVTGGDSGNGSASGDDSHDHHLPLHLRHHALMSHALYTRPHSVHGELTSVPAN
jgi:hypothetical protein